MTDDKTKKAHAGRFKKGVSGNKAGRPSKKKQAAKIIERMKSDLPDNLDPKKSKDSLEKLLSFYNAKFDEAASPDDQEKYARYITDISAKLLAFQESRYTSIDSEDSIVTELVVTWETPEVGDKDHPSENI